MKICSKEDGQQLPIAKNTGLISRELYNLSFVGSTIPIGSVPWEEKANRGYIVRDED